MAKTKNKGGIPNKHLHARIAYLQQAVTYLSTKDQNSTSFDTSSTSKIEDGGGGSKPTPEDESSQRLKHARAGDLDDDNQKAAEPLTKPQSGGLPLYLTGHLTQVARKSQIRLQTSVKHSICKRCGTVLVERSTSSKFVENLSKGGKKTHADVLVVECGTCGTQKRWPVGAQRQGKKSKRGTSGEEDSGTRPNLAEAGPGLHQGCEIER